MYTIDTLNWFCINLFPVIEPTSINDYSDIISYRKGSESLHGSRQSLADVKEVTPANNDIKTEENSNNCSKEAS